MPLAEQYGGGFEEPTLQVFAAADRVVGLIVFPQGTSRPPDNPDDC